MREKDHHSQSDPDFQYGNRDHDPDLKPDRKNQVPVFIFCSVEIIFMVSFCGIVRVTPSLPQRGRHPKGASPLDPRFYHFRCKCQFTSCSIGRGSMRPRAPTSPSQINFMISGRFSTEHEIVIAPMITMNNISGSIVIRLCAQKRGRVFLEKPMHTRSPDLKISQNITVAL